MRIAFATWSGEPHLTADDQLAQIALIGMGHSVTPVPWDVSPPDWREYDVVVLRSTWNYHRAFDAFGGWLAALDAASTVVLNPVPLIRWNVHKRYLLGLAAAGIRTPETMLIPRGSDSPRLDRFRTRGWTNVVIKPAVSANAYKTERVALAPSGALEERVRELSREGDVLVQQVVPEVERHGEHSAIFFDGEFSHAVLKRAAPGDFRVQEKFGGTSEAVQPEATLLNACHAIFEAMPSRPAYARLDLVATSRGFTLMEIELIEPTLFLGTCAGAPERFAQAILAHATEHTSR